MQATVSASPTTPIVLYRLSGSRHAILIWESEDTSIATVNTYSGVATFQGAGTTLIDASWTIPDYEYDNGECEDDGPDPDGGSVSATGLGPDHVVVLNDSNGPPGACSTTGIWVRQMTVSLQDANNVTVPQNYSTVETYSSPQTPTSSCPSPWNTAPTAS